MGNIHKIGDEYYIEFYARGLQYQQKAGKDLRHAEELLRDTEAKIANGELQTIPREIAWDIFIAEFMKHAQGQFHPHSIRRLKFALEHFADFLSKHFSDVTKISQITPRVIEEYKAYLIKFEKKDGAKFNPKKINFQLLLLREALEHGIKTGFINDNPTLHVRLLEIKMQRVWTLSDSQLSKVLESASEPCQSILTFIRQTGLRLEETVDLTWQQVDLNRGVIFIKLREIPLTALAITILKERFEKVIDHKARVFLEGSGGGLSSEQLLERFELLKTSTGLPPQTCISVFRHSFACVLLNKKISFLMVGKILGIRDIAKLMLYAAYIPLEREDITQGSYGA